MTNLLVFEDSDIHGLNPIVASRPMFDVLAGILSPLEKIRRYFGHLNLTLACRAELKHVVRLKHPSFLINQVNVGSPLLIVSGRVLMTAALAQRIAEWPQDQNVLLVYQNWVVAAYICDLDLCHTLKALFESQTPSHADLLSQLRTVCVTQKIEAVPLLENPWDLFRHLAESISEDFAGSDVLGVIKGHILPFAALYEENNIYVGKHTHIEDFVVLDARKGPIYIDEYVVVEAGSRLEGPLYIGAHSHIAGARIKTSSIGPWCKVGGEVSMSVFQGYTNKAHDGFFGHTYVGEWVNVGAGSMTSNLKNTYGPVSLVFGSDTLPSQEIFLGSLIGDHVKLGIGTHLTTGTTIGMGATLLGTAIHGPFVPPFSWGMAGAYDTHVFEKFLLTASRMMSRRGQSLTPFHESYFEWVFSRYAEVSPGVAPIATTKEGLL